MHRGILASTLAAFGVLNSGVQEPGPNLRIGGVSHDTREYWMQEAVNLMVDQVGPCPTHAYGSVVVNHTDNPQGTLICHGVNSVARTGDPTQHGEINNIQNCARLFESQGYTPLEALALFKDLSLYTTAEACPMCASAIRWAGFKEYIYGTSINGLIRFGREQIEVSSWDVMKASYQMSNRTPRILGEVGTHITDPYHAWLFTDAECPSGCARAGPEQPCAPN